MTKSVSTSKKPRKQHTPEFRNEALKLAERIGVAAAARELSLYESQLYAWCSKINNARSSSEREQEMSVEIARLKRQLAEQAEELTILQKAATYFAQRLNEVCLYRMVGQGKKLFRWRLPEGNPYLRTETRNTWTSHFTEVAMAFASV